MVLRGARGSSGGFPSTIRCGDPYTNGGMIVIAPFWTTVNMPSNDWNRVIRRGVSTGTYACINRRNEVMIDISGELSRRTPHRIDDPSIDALRVTCPVSHRHDGDGIARLRSLAHNASVIHVNGPLSSSALYYSRQWYGTCTTRCCTESSTVWSIRSHSRVSRMCREHALRWISAASVGAVVLVDWQGMRACAVHVSGMVLPHGHPNVVECTIDDQCNPTMLQPLSPSHLRHWLCCGMHPIP